MKHKKTIGLLLVSIIILAIMLWFIGIDQVIEALRIANLWLILLAFLIQIITFYLYTLRWNIINKLTGINIGIRKLFPITLLGLGVNNITPAGRGGGEPVRAYVLAKNIDKPMEETFATVVADKALDTFPFIVLAIVTLVGFTLYFDLDTWILVVMILAVIAIVIFLLVLVYMCINKKFGDKVTNWIIGLVRRFYKKNSDELEQKIQDVVVGFQDTMKLLISNKTTFYKALPLSFVIWIFEILRVYVVFLAFGANVSPIVIGEVFILASLVGMIPALPGGLGAIDGVMIIFYSAAGVPPSLSAAATVIERLISYWMPTIVGMICLSYYGASVLDKISFSSDSDKMTKDLEELSHEEDK